MSARRWADNTNFDGDIAYFFEAGHASQSEANQIMEDIFEIEELRNAYRYGGHAFLPKPKAALLQTGDIIAWLWRKHLADAGKRKMRQDLASILSGPKECYWSHFGPKEIQAFIDSLKPKQSTLDRRRAEAGLPPIKRLS
jgi:hypothetical protein